MRQALTITLALLCLATAASSKETEPNPGAPDVKDYEPHATGKPVTTTTIKHCPEGYELVTRANGVPGCAKDIVPTNN
jgi:hypothetical protein